MQIDWFTLIAQVVNFLVLVWLLRRFLYGRIVRAMDEREAGIMSRLEEAARKRSEAEREAEDYRVEKRKLDEERERILARAREEAESGRQKSVEEARADVAMLKAEWLGSLQREKDELLRELRERTGRQVLAVARRALAELAGVELEQHMVAVFLEHVGKLDPGQREAMAEAIRRSDREVELRTAFPVNADSRERITRCLREHVEDGLTVRFEVEPDLGCGIELRAHSHRMQWNMESYLDRLEETFFQSLEERAQVNGKSPRDDHAAGGTRTDPKSTR